MKLTSLIDQNKNPQFPENAISAAKEELRQDLSKLNLDAILIEYKKWSARSLWTWLVFGIAAIITVIMVMSVSTVVGFVFAAISVVSVLIALHFYRKATEQKKLWKSKVSNSVDYYKLIKVLIEEKFENVKVPLEEKSKVWNKSTYRSSDIPNDANVSKTKSGIALQINGHTVGTTILTWHWVRKHCNGKTCTTQHYYKDNFYMFSSDFQERFDGFAYSMSRSGIFFNKGKELENDMFNKKFSYLHNDPLRLRVLLTPLIQETFVNEFNQFIESGTACFVKEPKEWVLYKTLTRTPFSLNFRVQDSVEKAVEDVIRDIADDAKYLLDNLSFVATFRELIK